jgi:hypothetical protein
MKKQRNAKHRNREDYERDFSDVDTRYYGLWKKGEGKSLEVKIDPKRFQEATSHKFSQERLDVMNRRTTPYFHPAKLKYGDYNCNHFIGELKKIKKDWENNFAPLIEFAVQRIEKPKQLTPGDYDNFQMGISSALAASAWANGTNYKNEREYREKTAELVYGMYSQFIQQMASRIEAVTVKILTNHNMMADHFDRNILYGGYNGSSKKQSVRELPHFSSHDKLYCIWNFLKHNSLSTYNTIKDKFPDILRGDEFEQGQLAIYHIHFSEKLILDLIDGCSAFFKEYCELMFDENYDQAQWNYHEYFYKIVRDKIKHIINPLDLTFYDCID